MQMLESETPKELIALATERFASFLKDSDSSGELRILLTGGTLGIEFVRALGKMNLELGNVRFIFGDERYVGLNDPERNEAQALDAWPDLQEHLIRFPDADSDLEKACGTFNKQIHSLLGELANPEPAFDLVILGMGPDGHVASLFPGSEHDREWIVSERNSPKPPAERLSFSFDALNRAREVWFLVSGEAKSQAVRCAISEGCELPAARVKGLESTLWFVDRELRRAL